MVQNSIPPNAISVDVEDWLQSTLDPNLPLTDRFQASTRKVLQAFADANVRGTFFILGLAAEKAPQVVREIHDAGHEIQSHGYGHQLVYTLTPEQFRQDLLRSKGLIEDQVGVKVTGYRAPVFSILEQNLWALDVLVECGFEYDSSLFPVRTGRYGVEGTPLVAHRLKAPAGGELIELPVATYAVAGKTLPVGGGGYFRLFPYWVIRRAIAQQNAKGQPVTIYMHPYEYDPVEFRELGVHVPLRKRLHQGIGRRGFPKKVRRMLADTPFGPMCDIVDWVRRTQAP
jgi:polysaccharide deacetylase family protein (PEP-CTERM system associated)